MSDSNSNLSSPPGQPSLPSQDGCRTPHAEPLARSALHEADEPDDGSDDLSDDSGLVPADKDPAADVVQTQNVSPMANGMTAFREGKFREAIVHFCMAIFDSTSTASERAWAHVNVGQCWNELGDHIAAATFYSTAAQMQHPETRLPAIRGYTIANLMTSRTCIQHSLGWTSDLKARQPENFRK